MTTIDRKTQMIASQTASTAQLRQWLEEHHDPIVRRWLDNRATTDLPHQPLATTGYLPDPAKHSDLHDSLLRALTDRSIANQLFAIPPKRRDESVPVSDTTALDLATWHALLDDMRLSIIAELQATTPPDQAFDLLLVTDAAINQLETRLIRVFQQQLKRVTSERDQFQIMYKVTQEITSYMDLDQVAQSTLEGILKIAGADAGVMLILDRESGRLFPWPSIDWELAPIEPDQLPDDWTQGWRDGPVSPIGNVKTLPPAEWQTALQVPSEISALIVAPIVANSEFYGVLVIGSKQAHRFTSKDAANVKAITTQVAGVTENAEVYRLINRQAQELGSMLRYQQEEASKSRAILESIADGVVVNNLEGQIVLVNPAAEQLLSRVEHSLLATDVHRLIEAFNEPGKSLASAAIEQALSPPKGSSPSTPTSIMLELHNRVISAQVAPVVTPRDDLLGVVTIFRDITKEVEADRAKNDFISTVSHELRTPMTAIKGYTDLLHGGAVGPLNDNQKHFLSITKNNTDRLIALINDLLDISRIETGRIRFEPSLVKMGEIVANVVEAMAARAEEQGLALTYEVDAGLPEIMGDRNRLYQVLTNLIGNAINYTPKGSVTVEATNVGMAIQVSVRDTGIGIRPEDISRIFDRFFRSDDPIVQEARGTGLGLPIVKMFVEMHGGRVWVDSNSGKGSTFTFILPIPGAEPKPEELMKLAPAPITAPTVLVVEDDPDIAQLVRLQLESNGYKVITTSRGQQALEVADSERVDLIILDRLLPDMEGLEVLDTLKADRFTAEIPVIMLTIVEDDGEAMTRGASAYLIKPIDQQLLVDQVQTALSRQGRVLIVEDDRDTIDMLVRVLRRVGFSTETASDGYEALAVARRVRPDVIILDLRLPGMDGYEALSHLKRSIVTSTIPIVAVSAHATNPAAERKRLIMLGASDFLPKPLTIEEVIASIDRALEANQRPSLATDQESPAS